MPLTLRDCVVAIGNFDGVHRGHQAVLERALELAHRDGLPAVVLTFEPHPRSFFKPNEPIERLTDAVEKAEILRLMGFDAVVEQPFTADFQRSRQKTLCAISLLNDCMPTVLSRVMISISARRVGAHLSFWRKLANRRVSACHWWMLLAMKAEISFRRRGFALSCVRAKSLKPQVCLAIATGLAERSSMAKT